MKNLSAFQRAKSFAQYLSKQVCEGHSIQKNGPDNYGIYNIGGGLVAKIGKHPQDDQILMGEEYSLAHNLWCAN